MCSGRGTPPPPGPSLRRATRGWWRVPRTTPCEARTQSPEPERWRSASCTMRHGARSLLHQGRGQHHWLRCGRRWGSGGTRGRLRAGARPRGAADGGTVGGSLGHSSSLWWASLPLGGLPGSRSGQGSIAHAMLALAVEYIAPSPAVSRSPSTVVDYLAPAPAVVFSPAPVMESIAPVPAVVFRPRQLRSIFHRCPHCFKRQRL